MCFEADRQPRAKYADVPAVILDSRLDPVLIKILKDERNALGIGRDHRYVDAICSLIEALIVAPRICFKVRNENFPLAALTTIFGPQGTLQLLSDGAIEFLNWPQEFLLLEKHDPPPEGYNPFLYAKWGPPELWEPQRSCDAGLAFVGGLTDADRRQLSHRASRAMSPITPTAPAEAREAVLNAISAGNLEDVGIRKDQVLSELPEQLKKFVSGTMADLAEAAVLVDREMALFDAPTTWNSLVRSATVIRSGDRVVHTASEILRAEKVPSIRELLRRGELTPGFVLELRKSREADDFRKWLWSRPDPSNPEHVLDAYRSLFSTAPRRLSLDIGVTEVIRTVGLTIVGSALGSAVDSGVGPLVGGTAAWILGNAAGSGMSLLDTLLEKISTGRGPRAFASRLRDRFLLGDGAASSNGTSQT